MSNTPAPRRVTVVPRPAVTTHTEAAAPVPTSGPPSDPEGRREAIKATIAQLDLSDPTHVTEDGKPDATVLSDLLGWKVSAKERDDAWAEVERASTQSQARK
ncbi:MAG: hypothetical protein QF754_11070 [Alphaproteobacteria bacterium]|jgi:hypothetical protein|nr:hypothetical protein [Alphaproteobacteria bacterium]